MTRFERTAVRVSSILVGATGLVYGWMKYLMTSSDPFSVIHHPLQPLILKLHILTAPLLVFALGTVAVRHVWAHFRSGTRRKRRSGVAVAAGVVPMVASGYLIQAVTGAGLLLSMVIAHVGTGLVYLAGLAAHEWVGRRSSRRS